MHLACCCPEPVVVLRSLVVVQVSQVDRARSSCFVSLYPPGVVVPCHAEQSESSNLFDFRLIPVYRAFHRVLDEFRESCLAAFGGLP